MKQVKKASFKSKDYIIRSWGSPYRISILKNHFGIFNIDSTDDDTFLKKLLSRFDYMTFKDGEIQIEDTVPSMNVRNSYSATNRQIGINAILHYVCNYSNNILFTDAEALKTIPQLLKDWEATDILIECFHEIFPYYRQFNYCEPTEIVAIIDNKSYSHWQLLQKSREKEGDNCKMCYKSVPWLIQPTTYEDKSTCSCTLYYNDMLERVPNNPYFDKDNLFQRQCDNQDALPRQSD